MRQTVFLLLMLMLGIASTQAQTIVTWDEAAVKALSASGPIKYDDSVFTSTISDVTLTGSGSTVSGTSRPWIQQRSQMGCYLRLEIPAYTASNDRENRIKQIALTISSATNTSGGVENISMHTAYSGRVALTTADMTGSSDMTGVAYTDTITDKVATLTPTGNYRSLYIKVSSGARVWGIRLTYENYAKQQYTVTFVNNGEPVTSVGTNGVKTYVEQTVLGDLPTLESSAACDATSNVFVGWSEMVIEQKTALKPSMVTADTKVTHDMTLHAVWAKQKTK